MRLVIKTFLRTRDQNGTLITFLSGGKPVVYTNSDYRSVIEMREQLAMRNRRTHEIEDIANGIKITPMPGFGHPYAWQEVTLEE